MKIVHISRQRYDFILSQGYRFSIETVGTGTPFEIADPNAATYHILDGELALCETCGATCQSVDANSPSELETVKSFPLDRAIIMLRNQRQSDILTIREHWTTCTLK